MRKFCRLCLPLLIFTFVIAVATNLLLSIPALASRPDPLNLQTESSLTREPITSETPLLIQAIDSVSITYDPPVAGFPSLFTATVSSEPDGGGLASTASIFYAWSFGDGSDQLLTINKTTPYTYSTPATYTVIVTAFDTSESDIVAVTQSISVTVVRPSQTYLPVVMKNFTPPVIPADLTCSLIIEPANPDPGQPVLLILQMENLGEGVADGFWVDLYVNPVTPPQPGRENRIPWQNACGGPSSCSRGIAWSINNQPLYSGDSRTLVSIPSTSDPVTGQGFDPTKSSWSGGIFSAGTYRFYAYVDSINGVDEAIDGAVLETDETNNRCQGNLVIPSTATTLPHNKSGATGLPDRN